MAMKPKRRIALSREARWQARVKTWRSMDSWSTDGSSDSTSSDEDTEEPSRETFEAPASVHLKTWQEEDEKPSAEELRETLDARNRVPPEEDSLAAVLNPKIDEASARLASDGVGRAGHYSMQSGLCEGSVASATSPEHIKYHEWEMPHQSASFDCTVCGKKLFSVRKVLEHPDLGVGICRPCYNFLFSSPYTKDLTDCSEEQCRWCGQGGRIVMCDECDKSFCESCIVRNYGPKTLARIVSSSHWSCFLCRPELLRVPIDELKEFQTSAARLQRSETNSVLCKRNGPSCAGGQRIAPRDASADMILGTEVGGATIAELLAQEEERRKRQKEVWSKSGRVKPPAHTASKKHRATPSLLHPASPTEVHHPAITDIKQEQEEVAIGNQAPGSATTDEKQKHWAAIGKRAPDSATTKVKQEQEVAIGEQSPPSAATEPKQGQGGMEKEAPAPATPAPRTWIRPHQWEQKRREAAERRKRAAEAELAWNVSNEGLTRTN